MSSLNSVSSMMQLPSPVYDDARLLCTPAFAASHPDWASGYIRNTCLVGVGPRLHPKCSACTLAARTPARQTWTSSHWLLPRCALLSKACRTPRRSSLCSGAASTTLRPHTCCGAMVTAWTLAACSTLTRAWRRDWPLHSVTTSGRQLGAGHSFG